MRDSRTSGPRPRPNSLSGSGRRVAPGHPGRPGHDPRGLPRGPLGADAPARPGAMGRFRVMAFGRGWPDGPTPRWARLSPVTVGWPSGSDALSGADRCQKTMGLVVCEEVSTPSRGVQTGASVLVRLSLALRSCTPRPWLVSGKDLGARFAQHDRGSYLAKSGRSPGTGHHLGYGIHLLRRAPAAHDDPRWSGTA